MLQTTDHKALLPDNISGEAVRKHFQRSINDRPGTFCAYWKLDSKPEPLEWLLDVVRALDPKKRIQLEFEYDPDFPQALCFATGFQDPDAVHIIKVLDVKQDDKTGERKITWVQDHEKRR